ncbi:MAG: tRNA (adenosine(37)-N6)-threonylcarbamoyltransferase complex ATPase subunit type 1 TsaE [Mycobacteriales bacterium]
MTPPIGPVALPGARDARELGERIARLAEPGDVIALAGPLGAGKTVVAAGIGAGLGVDGPVVSPTFVIARVHGGGRLPLVHVDAYRLGSVGELDDLDLDESLDASVTVVEWGEGLADHLADGFLLVRLTRSDDEDDDVRVATLTPVGPRWLARAGALAALAVAVAPHPVAGS